MISDRLTTFRSSVALPNDLAIGNNTPKHQYMKKQVMAALKQHGDGLKNLESKTLFYGDQMLKVMEEYNSEPFEPGRLIHLTMTHIMLVLMFGYSSEADAANFLENEYNIGQVLGFAGSYFMLDIVPFLRFMPPLKSVYKTFLNVVDSTNATYEQYIAKRRNIYDHPDVKVFIEHFFKLNIMNKDEDISQRINMTDIRSLSVNVFTAGMSPPSKTLEMMLAILVNHPEIQDALYRGIDEVIGKRKPKMEDKLSMPYTQAVILETFRYHSVLPVAIPHVAKYDSDLQGYHIPAGTIVFPNLWALHHDERYWESPLEFNPNRWLENGKVVPPDHIKKQRLLPFGAGRRQCAGEVFAKNRLFILIAMMLQKFKFVPAKGHPMPNDDPSDCTLHFVLHSNPYKLSVEPRN